jgi:uncharacterized protein with FMN-binding domain
MRFAKTFFAALALTFAAVAAVKAASPAEDTTSAVCNEATRECARVKWSDGTSTI